MDPTHGPVLWHRLWDPTHGPNSWTWLLDPTCCPILDLWIVHVWEVFTSWIVPAWNLKNKELFRIGLPWEVFQLDPNMLLSFLTQCYYPHTSKESVSPIYRNFIKMLYLSYWISYYINFHFYRDLQCHIVKEHIFTCLEVLLEASKRHKKLVFTIDSTGHWLTPPGWSSY